MAKKYYIIGTTANEFVIGNILLPKHSYDDVERSHGKCPYTEVSEEEYENILKPSNAFNDLLKVGYIQLLEKLPAFAMTGDEKAVQYKRQLNNAESKLQERDEEIAALKAKLAAYKATEESETEESETEE